MKQSTQRQPKSNLSSDYRELIQRLFAEATFITDGASETAIAGQSRKLNVKQYATRADDLRRAATKLNTIAEALLVVIDQHREHQARL